MKNLRARYLTCLFASLSVTSISDSPEEELAAGLWVGGYGSIEGERPHWKQLSCTFDVEGEHVEGSLHSAAGEEALQGGFAGGQLEFSVQRDGFDVFYSGTLEDGMLVGECAEGGVTYDFQLVRVDPDHAGQTACGGIYSSVHDAGNVTGNERRAKAKGARIYVRPGHDHLSYRDDGTGVVRTLYRVGRDTYVAGERYSIPYPKAFEIRFERDDDGTVVGFTREESGRRIRARRVSSFSHEDFRYRSFDDTEIVGELLRPESAGPHPAIVWVHGSGRAGHNGSGFWAMYFVDKGYAVLTVDKRGVGASGGTYEMPDGGHDNVPHMRRRSKDVRAAVQALGALASIDASRIGLVGASQAGWVIPQAAEGNDVAFSIILSGGATQISYEGVFSRLAAESDSSADALSIAECLERVRKHRARDDDFREHFAALPGPALWLYGDRDRSNPSQLCVELIEGVGKQHAKDFTITRFPAANHGLWKCRLGGSAEYPTLSHLAPGLDAAIRDWMGTKGLLASTP